MGCTNVQTRMDDEMVGMFTGMSVEQKAQILEFARFIMHGNVRVDPAMRTGVAV